MIQVLATKCKVFSRHRVSRTAFSKSVVRVVPSPSFSSILVTSFSVDKSSCNSFPLFLCKRMLILRLIMMLLLRYSLFLPLLPLAGGFVTSPIAFTSARSKDSPRWSSRLFVADEDLTPLVISDNSVGERRRLPHAYVAEKTRKDFKLLNERTLGEDGKTPLVYLDSAATSQKPDAVLKALSDYYNSCNSNVHRGAHTLSREATDAYEQARDKVKNFIGARSRSEVVFTSGATEAINLVAYSYGRSFLKEGDEIILSVAEHHSNLVPWQIIAAEKGINLKFVELSNGGLDLDHLKSLLSERTKIVSFQHVSNVLACTNPVQEIVQMVRDASPECKIMLDACQSVPHMPVNVVDLGIDFLAASGHKMCGPTGIGFLWGREHILNQMPPWKGGGEMIDQVTLTTSTWQSAPGRFEAGTPAIAQAIGLGAAIDYLAAIGMDEINAYEHELAAYLYQRLSSIPGISILGPTETEKRAALCAFSHESVHPSDLSTFLDIEGVAVRSGHHCCQPLHNSLGISHSTRASLYFYNTQAEIDTFIDKLEHTLSFFDGIEAPCPGADDGFVPFL